MHFSLRSLAFVFVSAWDIEGREDKGELYVQSGQESLSTFVCCHITFLPTQALNSAYVCFSYCYILFYFPHIYLLSVVISCPLFLFSSVALTQ
jgi:hypothetical protein